MFSRDLTDDTLVTDEVMAEQGFIYTWVPAGTSVVPHIDVLYPGDLQLEIPVKSPTVLPYKDGGANQKAGVTNPWV
jgi:hypothetical protein